MGKRNPKYTIDPNREAEKLEIKQDGDELDHTELFEQVVIKLKKTEVPIYEYLCRKFGIDASGRLQGQRLEMSPFHYAQLVVMASMISSEEMMYTDDLILDTDHPSEIIDKMMNKAARAIQRADLHGTTRAFSHDVIDSREQYEELFDEAQEYELPDELVPRFPLENE